MSSENDHNKDEFEDAGMEMAELHETLPSLGQDMPRSHSASYYRQSLNNVRANTIRSNLEGSNTDKINHLLERMAASDKFKIWPLVFIDH